MTSRASALAGHSDSDARAHFERYAAHLREHLLRNDPVAADLVQVRDLLQDVSLSSLSAH